MMFSVQSGAMRRPKACFHEAGHAVVRWFLGHSADHIQVLSTDEISEGKCLRDRRGGLHRNAEGLFSAYSLELPPVRHSDFGEKEYDRLTSLGRARADMSVMEAMAGPVAEAKYVHWSTFACLLAGGEVDVVQAKSVAQTWCMAEGWMDVGIAGAKAVVGSRPGWAAVTSMAQELRQDGRVDGDNIDRICFGKFGFQPRHDAWVDQWPMTAAQLRLACNRVVEARPRSRRKSGGEADRQHSHEGRYEPV